MKDPLFNIGQKVKTVRVSGYDPEIDRLIGGVAGRQGTVEKYYCIGREEMPDRIKMFAYPEIVYPSELNTPTVRSRDEVLPASFLE